MDKKNNTGYRNTGDWNTGDWNTGYRNTGDWNTGYRNTGDWNTANKHVGCFNTKDAEKAYYFNREIAISDWENADKPDFIYEPSLNTWVAMEEMTDAEKKEHPLYETTEAISAPMT